MLSTLPEDTHSTVPARLPAFGHLSSVTRDTMYALRAAGFIFVSPWVCSPHTARHAATLLISTSGRPFVLECDGQRITTCAAFVPSLVTRSLNARDVGLVSINIAPGHPRYADLRRRGGAAVMALELAPFDGLQGDLCRAYRGELTVPEARHLLDASVEAIRQQLPGKFIEPSRQNIEMLALIAAEPDITLPEVVLRSGLSYDRASHALREALGVPLKSYQCWRKMNEAAAALFNDKMSMTEVAHQAGFSDSAHLSRTFKQQLGLNPSYLRQRASVRILW